MPVKGQVDVSNIQSQTEPVIVSSYGGTSLSSNLHAITEVMVQQTREELTKAAQSEPGAQKTIEIKVNSLESNYKFFYYHSQLHFDAKLGNGTFVSINVLHSSGVLAQDLDGCIAESVMKLLNDPRVRAYLAQ
jgi:hypothetical protein